MSKTIYVNYFNTFTIKSKTKNWHIEESRIKGGFNEKPINLGVRAYLVDEEYGRQERTNALIYSGIYNSKTSVNDTNVFNVAEEITKAVDSSYGSIQKLYADETNLFIIQEDKTQYALIDKDAIFTAEGGGLTASGAAVIGQIVPYQGEYGTVDPESFAVYGGRKYFADRNRGAVIRLTRDGVTEISNYGMRDFFRDNLDIANRIVGGYDQHDNQYIISIQDGGVNSSIDENNNTYFTLGFDETNRGWTSFYTFKPSFINSLNGNLYSLKRYSDLASDDNEDASIYKHNADSNSVNSFYGATYDKSKIKFIVNTEPSRLKTFDGIGYEGDEDWEVDAITTSTDTAASISKYEQIELASDFNDLFFKNAFTKQDNKYYAWIKNISSQQKGEVIFGEEISGVKGYFSTITMSNNSSTKKELFSVDTNVKLIN